MASNESDEDTSNDSGVPDIRNIFEKHLNEGGFTLPPQDTQNALPERYPIKSFKIKRCPLKACKILDTAKEHRLRLAASTCNTELVTRLLDEGINPNIADEHGRSPLHLASCRGYYDVVQKLLERGANPNVVDSLGNTPLHLAVISANSLNFHKVITLLLRFGADVRALDRSGKTPLELIESKVKLLEARYKNPSPEEKGILINIYNLIICLIVHNKNKTDKDHEKMLEIFEKCKILQQNYDIDGVLHDIQQLSITNV